MLRDPGVTASGVRRIWAVGQDVAHVVQEGGDNQSWRRIFGLSQVGDLEGVLQLGRLSIGTLHGAFGLKQSKNFVKFWHFVKRR
jgi:hypothetical protein